MLTAGIITEQRPGWGRGPNLPVPFGDITKGSAVHYVTVCAAGNVGFPLEPLLLPGIYCDVAPTHSIGPSHRNTVKKKTKWRPEGRLAICSNQLSVVLCQTKHLHSSGFSADTLVLIALPLSG